MQSTGKLLIVDDEADNLDVLRRRLERRGFQVVCRDHAVDIESVIAEHAIDLVLLDWMMPRRSGLDALTGLRKLYQLEQLPIIVVTAMGEAAVIAQALEAGANDYVAKPVELQILLARMNAQLARRESARELEEIKRSLETTVVERTRELVAANTALCAEIAERKSAETRAQTLAREDSLTGLANRRCFLEELNRLTHDGDPFALLLIDLDRFKPVNDVYGHQVGDYVLDVIGRRLQAGLLGGCMAARLGGDEFAVIAHGFDDVEAISALGRGLMQSLTLPIGFQATQLQVGASMGAAIFPNDGRTTEDLLHSADAAMRQAKSTRGSLMFFDVTLADRIKHKAILEAELRPAIFANEVKPYFQPIVDLSSGDVAGYEILARWPHAQRGMIGPSEFIPIAEEAGLITPLFWSLLRAALNAALSEPGDFYLSINTSPTQIRDQWFPHKVLHALQETGYPARRLMVEVTESSTIADMDRAKASLLSLRNQGVRIALDDFGTGFSSLSLLRELPLDAVKIDRSFVSPMLQDASAATIVHAVLSLGKAMKFDVIAEGIETAGAATALRESGCGYGQGYLFGAAAPRPQTMTAPIRAYG